jgi:hypothetical protein
MVYVSTAAGIISDKNNEPTTVMMTCTFVDTKDFMENYGLSFVLSPL